MAAIQKAHTDFRIRRPVIGCGIQRSDCLALCVGLERKGWHLHWGMLGPLEDKEFGRQLAKRVWRRQFWVAPAGVEQEVALCALDLSFQASPGKRPKSSEVLSALRTQVSGRLLRASDPSVITGIQVQGEDGARHTVGAGIPRDFVTLNYRMWRQKIGIINPHIAPVALGFVNAYLALYPAGCRQDAPRRMLIVEGARTTHVLLLDGWRLLDALAYPMLEDQTLDAVLIESWAQDFAERAEWDWQDLSVTLVRMEDTGANGLLCEHWHPWRDAAVHGSREVLALIQQYPGLAFQAFGMALQGGG